MGGLRTKGPLKLLPNFCPGEGYPATTAVPCQWAGPPGGPIPRPHPVGLGMATLSSARISAHEEATRSAVQPDGSPGFRFAEHP
jgi:hypothetical protein